MHSIALPSGDGEGLIATSAGRRRSSFKPDGAMVGKMGGLLAESDGCAADTRRSALLACTDLTGGELRVVLAVARDGYSGSVNSRLGKETVKKHLQRAFRKTGTRSRPNWQDAVMASHQRTNRLPRRATRSPPMAATINLPSTGSHRPPLGMMLQEKLHSIYPVRGSDSRRCCAIP